MEYRTMNNPIRTFALMVFVATTLGGCAIIELARLNSTDQTKFTVEGNSLHMDGIINSRTPDSLRAVLDANPQLTEIVLHDVPGSVDDEANLVASRMVRNRGLNTRLVASSEIASGGTDFFLAGVQRRFETGAKIGVHSWGTLFDSGAEVPKNDPRHQLYLDYYNTMGITPEFYWYTLNAASADDIHWMTPDEIRKYDLATAP